VTTRTRSARIAGVVTSESPLSFRFVHAADIHLDSPLGSLALRAPALADLIGNTTRKSFVRVVDLGLGEQVDALLLSGDVYDGEQTSMKTARFLADQNRDLGEAYLDQSKQQQTLKRCAHKLETLGFAIVPKHQLIAMAE